MADQFVAVHLLFETTTPPAAVAMQVGQAVTQQIPDSLMSISWSVATDDDHEEASDG